MQLPFSVTRSRDGAGRTWKALRSADAPSVRAFARLGRRCAAGALVAVEDGVDALALGLLLRLGLSALHRARVLARARSLDDLARLSAEG
jgi:hypothetical protein